MRPGYSLLEVLVVLAILGVTAAIATPNIARMVERRAADSVVQTVSAAMIDLRVRAHVWAEPIGSEAIADHIRSDLPAGWNVEVPEGFAFNSLGYCSGGEIVLVQPNGARRPRQFSEAGCYPTSGTPARNPTGFAFEARRHAG
jgi:prepilin-type N-terminal cleavage/methylation domain-containing protein